MSGQSVTIQATNLGKMFRLVILLVVVTAAHAGKHDKYEGHQLFRVTGSVEVIAPLEGYLDVLSVSPASRSATKQLEAVVRLSPEEKLSWLPYFDGNNMAYIKMVDNLADILRDEESVIIKSRASAKRNGKSISFDTYYNHNEINAWLDSLAIQFPDLLTVVNAGLSTEGRQIKYVRISSSGFEDLSKPLIVIDATVHAREWVTPPVACYIIQQLVVNAVDTRLTNEMDWVIIPVANPDGYEYSINEDRMWRKTRSTSHVNGTQCPGIDGNRNFDHYHGTTASAANPCAITYEGPVPFSEPEIKIIRDVVLRDISRVELYISLHSYGNMFLYSWGNNGSVPDNGDDLQLAGDIMAQEIDKLALEKASPYIVGNAANVLYFTTGTSRDWTRSVGIPLTYTLELPGYEYGFLVPPTYVEQIVTETWAGIEAGANHVLSYSPAVSAKWTVLLLSAVFLFINSV